MTGKLESLTCPTTRQSFAENLSTGTALESVGGLSAASSRCRAVQSPIIPRMRADSDGPTNLHGMRPASNFKHVGLA